MLHQKKQIMQKCLVDALIKDIACTLVVRSAFSMLFTFPCISSGHTRHSCFRQWSLWTSVQSMWFVFGIKVYRLRSYLSVSLRFVYSRHSQFSLIVAIGGRCFFATWHWRCGCGYTWSIWCTHNPHVFVFNRKISPSTWIRSVAHTLDLLTFSLLHVQ
jgi:hypothetical protein